MTAELRYDWLFDSHGLSDHDVVACALLTDGWAARARLRQRWLERKAREPQILS